VDCLLFDGQGNLQTPDSFYRIDPKTAATGLVGRLSGAQCVTGLGTVDGSLYGFALDSCASFIGAGSNIKIDQHTAAASFISHSAVNTIVAFSDIRDPANQ